MVLIECFSDSCIDNIAGSLRLRPDQLFLLGDQSKMAAMVQRCRTILYQRGLDIRIEPCDIAGKTMTEIAGLLSNIVAGEADCVIDLTGGDETVIMAVGAMIAGMNSKERSRISVQKYDQEQDAGVDCIGSGLSVPGRSVALSVQELIALHGGIVHPGTYQPPKSCTPRQLRPLWEIASQMPKEWNRNIAILGEFESRSDSKTQVFLPLDYIRHSIAGFHEKEQILRQLLGRLSQRGIIEDHSSRNAISYTYRTPLYRYCTQKAGNVLEVKALLEARALRKNGKPFFDDCLTSVNIDWDGIVYDPADRVAETRNEIDLVLMHGLTPLFVSCKNGNVEEDELYKLHTVADRFGGPYARKMLIATDMSGKSPASSRALAQRAWDMDILLVTDAADLEEDEWPQLFEKAML